MTDAAEHLDKKYRGVIDLPQAERIDHALRPCWIGYTRAHEVLKHLEDLLRHPKVHRMPNVLIIGSSNNGKSTIVERFVDKHLGRENATGDGAELPVVRVQAPPKADEGLLYDKILAAVHSPYRPSDTASRKLTQVLYVLRQIHVQMLMIDDLHNMAASSGPQQKVFFNTLRHLGNELRIPIVGACIQDMATALASDPQLANRFEPEVLPHWKLDDTFLSLLASFEKTLPLKKPSILASPELAPKIHDMGESILGEFATLLRRASVVAIQTGEERITPKILDQVRWIPASLRRIEVARSE